MPIDALRVLLAQLRRDLLAIANFLFTTGIVLWYLTSTYSHILTVTNRLSVCQSLSVFTTYVRGL